MADNLDTGDEVLKNPGDAEPVTTAGDLIASPDPGLTQKEETGNMETHAHHMHHAPGKKIWHYFYEFLMLFLAVFCGFLAENQREHYVERQRAKEYAKTLVEDLAKDTVELLDVIKEDKFILTCFDSISSITQKGIIDNKVPGSYYYYSTIGTVVATVVWNNATLTQITQSGNLRYFRNIEIIKKISRYYSISEHISNGNLNDRRFREKSMELRNKVLSNYYFTRYADYNTGDWLKVPDSLMNNILPLQTQDAQLLNEFANSFESRRAPLGVMIKYVYPISLNTARDLMRLLKEEYGLE